MEYPTESERLVSSDISQTIPKPGRKLTTQAMLKVQNFVNGKFLASEKFIDSYDPSTGEVWARIPDSGGDDVDKAVKAATAAFPGWSSTSVQQRSKVMLRLADLIEERLEEYAKAESRDQGKSVSFAKMVDIPRAVHNFRFFATAILHHTEKSSFLDESSVLEYTSRVAAGVAGLISPWNLPLYLLTFKIAPAIAWGNCVVCKPSEMTSVTAWMMCDLLNCAGVPPGVVNMVFGTGPSVGDAIVKHPDVRLISFTGSTATARHIRLSSAPFCKKLSLELGGKNPAIVFSDVDLEPSIPVLVRSCFANQGEICLCSSRIFVQREIYQQFLRLFVEGARKIKVGDPADPSTQMGALVSKEHLAKVKGYVAAAKADGATIECGEGVDSLDLPPRLSKGYYMRPTVITNVSDSSRCMREEIFGPVVCVVPFDTEEEVVRRANDTEYGLSATVWGRDVSRVNRVARQLQAGTIWINCWLIRDLSMPFGGMKSSGVGRESTEDSMEFFTEQKTISTKI